jgi:hypothetical protein
MNYREKDMLRHLFQKDSIAELGLTESSAMVRNYPYFAVGRLLHTEKLRALKHPALEKEIGFTALYFQNPLWLNYLLNDDDEAMNPAVIPTSVEAATTAFIPSPVQPVVVDQSDPIPVADEATQDIPIPETVLINESASPIPVTAPADEAVTAYEASPIAAIAETVRTNAAPTDLQVVAPGAESGTMDQEKPAPVQEIEPAQEATPPAFEPSPVESGTMDQQEPAPVQKTEPAQAAQDAVPLAFEPFHTVDYFASQGIKLSLDAKPKDKLGMQMKSFTEWLKSMKKIHPERPTMKDDPETDQHIRHIAADSLATGDVVTEAMAEVLEKQGKNDKAIELYRKLSLLNPDKSVYFATKIDHLNT